ncbi:MAG: MerR family transcriptional regulator [Bacteroidia bacterium]|nr:MerR family transcriptional regulator [Bacteroidia bacterium]
MTVDSTKQNLFSEFVGLIHYEGLKPLIERLNEKHFTKKDFQVTYKTLHVWAKEGLLTDDKEDPRDWKRFSFVEYAWMNIIIKLKNFGMSTEKILLTKKVLATPFPVKELIDSLDYATGEGMKYLNKHEQKIMQSFPNELLKLIKESKDEPTPKDIAGHFTMLTFILGNYIITRNNVYFIIDKRGKVFPWAEDKRDQYIKLGFGAILEKDHISISLAGLVRDYIMYEKIENEEPRFHVLTEEEQEVIKYIREKKLSELTIRFDGNNKISLIEATENLDTVNVEARYLDHILRHGYQDISYTTAGGKIVKFQRTTKKKFKAA